MKKLLTILVILAFKLNGYSQSACNQSTLAVSNVFTVNATRPTTGGNLFICPGVTVYDTSATGFFGVGNAYLSPNSKFIYKSVVAWSNTKIYVKSTSTLVIKGNTQLPNLSVSGFTLVTEPGATIINQTTVAITNTISCGSLTPPTVNCPSCFVSINNVSSNTLCAGNSTTLSASGANSYTWSPGSIQSPTLAITPAATTIYTVTGNCGNTSSSATTAITVVNTPTVNVSLSSSTVCIGQSVSGNATGASTYTWMPGNLVGANQTLNPAATTVYTITGSNGSCNSNSSKTLTVINTPTVNVSLSSSTVCTGQSVSGNATGASTYTWMPGNLVGANQTLNPAATTVYTITGSNGSCSSNSSKTLTVIMCTSILENSKDFNFKISPNPCSDYLEISIPVFNAEKKTVIEILNTLGQVIQSQTITDSVTQIDVKNLPKGIYFARLTSNNTLYIGRVIKE